MRSTRHGHRRLPPRLLVVLGSLLALCGATICRADNRTPETRPLNHAYAVYLGSGYYVFDERSVFIISVAPKARLRSEDDHPFGIRLRVNATFGFYDLDPKDFLDFDFPDRVGTFALVPGVEFPIRLKQNWTLMPFIDAGIASDTGLHELTYVIGTGFRSRAQWLDRRRTYVLWNELIYATNIYSSIDVRDDYSVLRTDLEARGIVKFQFGKRDWDFGLLGTADFYLDGVVLDSLLDDPQVINWRWQAGFTVGPTERWSMLKVLMMPRLGLTYVGGGGKSGVRFVIRTRY